jgi:branched-chain amino acid transport system ATP-binding protein
VREGPVIASRAADAEFLQVRSLSAGYGELRVLWDVDLRVADGQAVVLLGANGAGKTTLLRTLIGMLAQYTGEIEFAGRPIGRAPVHERVRAGIGFMTETGVFPALSVEENLLVGGYTVGHGETRSRLDRYYALFPDLRAKRRHAAASLSGGQRKMLGVAKTLIANPRLVLMDEPSSGLSPLLVTEVIDVLRQVREDHDIALLIAEQNVKFCEVADYVYVLEGGQIRFSGTVTELHRDDALRRAFFGLDATP